MKKLLATIAACLLYTSTTPFHCHPSIPEIPNNKTYATSAIKITSLHIYKQSAVILEVIALSSISRTAAISNTVLCIVAACGILLLPQSAAAGAQTGLSFCAQVLIPSLFPFMVLSSFVVKSGLSSFLSKPLKPITQHLFHLPGCTGATIVMALVGGCLLYTSIQKRF